MPSAVDFGRGLDRASVLIEADNCVCELVKMDSGKGVRVLGLINRDHPGRVAERIYGREALQVRPGIEVHI